jgi:hypothetical protein
MNGNYITSCIYCLYLVEAAGVEVSFSPKTQVAGIRGFPFNFSLLN